MRRVILSLTFLLITIGYISAQKNERCGSTIQAHQEMMDNNPEYKKRIERWKKLIEPIIEKRRAQKNPDCSAGAIQVPIAVHFDNGLVPTSQEACVIDVVVDQINEVNAEFAGLDVDASLINNFTSCFGAGILGDACLEFCLATQNHPSGSGLIEGEYAVTFGTVSFNVPSGNYTPVNAAWSDYVNVYVDNLPGGLLGISNGIPGNFNGDGVMVDNCVFGTGNLSCSGVQLTGSAGCFPTYDEGETLAHELGHYFGLYHIWGDNSWCSGMQDNIADTPDMNTNYSGYLSCGNHNNCSDLPQTCGDEDMYMNFMSYAGDGCMYMFTSDQSDVMNATAVAEGFTTSSDKCSGAVPVADFTPSGQIDLCNPLCIDFMDQSSNDPDSWDWLFWIASGNITIDITNSTLQNPTVCITSGNSGTIAAMLTAGNVNGDHDTTKNLIVNVITPPTWYEDADGDNFGNNNVSQMSCTQPSGYVANNTDCDDNDPNNFPFNMEVCDGQDNDCDGLIDDDDPNVISMTWYRDLDGDGFGDEGNFIDQCTQPLGYVADNTDCDDNNAANYPGNTEICDFQDNDCDGLVDDADNDLVGIIYFEDADGDGFGNPNVSETACDIPPGFVEDNGDCDDTDNTVYPDAPELCDGIINDCNSPVLPENEIDNDGDGYVECEFDLGGWDGTSSVIGDNDCDDTEPTKYPGAPEICDGIINDCATAQLPEDEIDNDMDGYVECAYSALQWQGDIAVIGGNDCDDNDNNNFPGNTEICDGQDNDCDMEVDEGCGMIQCDDDSLFISTIAMDEYYAQDYIWSDALITDTEDILYSAGIDIDLVFPFEVETGGIFEAIIQSCSILMRLTGENTNAAPGFTIQLERMAKRIFGESQTNITLDIIHADSDMTHKVIVDRDNLQSKLFSYFEANKPGVYFIQHETISGTTQMEKLIWIK